MLRFQPCQRPLLLSLLLCLRSPTYPTQSRLHLLLSPWGKMAALPVSLIYNGFDLTSLPSVAALKRKYRLDELRSLTIALGITSPLFFARHKQPFLDLLWPLIHQQRQQLLAHSPAQPLPPPLPSPPPSPSTSTATKLMHQLDQLITQMHDERHKHYCPRQAVLLHQPRSCTPPPPKPGTARRSGRRK